MNKVTFFAMIVGMAVGAASLSSVVSAQDKGAAPAPAGGAVAGATAYDFEDDLVQGDLVRHDGELLSVRRRGNRASLIQIREHFIPEMLKSVEDL